MLSNKAKHAILLRHTTEKIMSKKAKEIKKNKVQDLKFHYNKYNQIKPT